MLAAWAKSSMKSRSEVASRELAVGEVKARALEAMVRSRARVAPATAPLPRGQKFMRARASVRRERSRSIMLT